MKKIKKILASLMVAVMVLTAAPLSGFVGLELNLDWLSFDWLDFTPKASAASYSGTCGDNLTWTLDTETGELVISGTGEMYDYSFSPTAPWYSYRSSIKKVTIVDDVTSIGRYAFYLCESLINITIPDSVTSIGNYAFYNCSGLASVTIPDSVTSIGASAFNGCSGLTSLTIGNGLVNIGEYVFYNCSGLTNITLPDSVTSIEDYAFAYCSGLTSLTIPDSVTSIGNYAFYNCSGLTRLTIPDSVTSIGNSAFSGCTGLTSVTIPDGVTSISKGIFYRCIGLANVTIPDSVTSIGEYAFYECTGLTSVIIGNGVTRIGESAFYGCTGLTELTMPISAKIDNTISFDGCTNIEKITLTKGNGTVQNYTTSTGSTNNTYYKATPWYISEYSEIIIEDGITGIGAYTFLGCSGLASITIPDSVTSIGEEAFFGCSGLTSITIPDSVTSIGEEAFYGCSGLTELTMPLLGKNIYSYRTFSGCTNIEKVTLTAGSGIVQNFADYYSYTPWYISREKCTEIIIEDGTTGIGSYTFKNCFGLTKIMIPDSVTSIGYEAFYNCSGLTSLTIPDSVTSIGNYAFSGCSGLTSITLSDSVTSIGEETFLGCSGLTSITIPDSVTSIGEEAFSGCSGLTELTMPISAYIDYAFPGCVNIEKVILTAGNGTAMNYVSYPGASAPYCCEAPWYISREKCTEIIIEDGVTGIGSYTFYHCSGLTSITIPDSVTSIGNYAFSGCSGLTSITIPDSITSIGSSAFSDCGDMILYLVRGSYSETYANENLIPYYYITDESTEDIISVTVTSKLSFEIDTQSGTLTINCSGNMPSFTTDDIPWAEYKGYIRHVIINDGCTSISANAFKNFNVIESVTIPDSVTSIGDSAFYGCSGLVSVTIGNGVTSIDNYAFYNCSGLASVTIPDSVTSIGASAFNGCSGLTSITIPDSVTSIGYEAFYNCSGLTSITIPDSVTSIGNHAFYNCSGLTSLTIPDSVTSIGNYAFYNCSGLTSLTIPDSVTSIGNYAFYNCSGLRELTMPISADFSRAFSGCTDIEKIILTKGNGTKRNYTSSNYSYTPWYISGCSEIVIEDGVTGIGDYMFYGCTNLGNITLLFSVQSIGSNAFGGCQNMDKLKVYNRNCAFGTEATSYYTTIVGYAGSTAEAYANEKGFDFELIPDDDHEHIYSNSCDAECNICGHTRTDLVHTYSSVCDVTCDLCTYKRTDVVHTYSNDCDTECNYCDFVRTPNHTDDNNDGLCDVCEKALSDILVGVTQNFKVEVGETVYIKFVPANSGVYTYYSSSDSDTYGYVYGVDKNTLASDDDSGGNRQFSITYTFKSGTVYYLGVKYFSSSNSGEIPVTIRLDQLICDHNHTYEEHKDSTCSENGYDKVICDDCGNTISDETLPLAEHDIKTDVFKPTCEEAGAKISYCKQCSYAYVAEHLAPLGHSELVWVTVKVPSTRNEGIMNQVCPACGEVFDTKTVPAISLSADSTANIDFETNTISGFNSGSSSIGDYLSATNNGYTFTCESEKIATGTVITLTAGEDTINEFEAVIFGDTNGDGWYDGQDAIIVDCLANGMLTQEDVGEAVYTAADCNHDGVIDQLDVALLNQAGTLLANVDQSKPAEVLLETSAEYVEYLDLIDQSPEIEVEDETDAPEVDVEDTPEADTEDAKVDIFEMILNFIRFIIEMILSRIPVPYK